MARRSRSAEQLSRRRVASSLWPGLSESDGEFEDFGSGRLFLLVLRDPIIYSAELVSDKRSFVPISRGKVCRVPLSSALCKSFASFFFCFYARAFGLIILFRL